MPPSRISGACNGCRSKKQKCSGDRSPPGCAQCVAAGVECTWPEQRKRGPSKGYIEALESRLHSAETLLLALLPLVDESVLEAATEKVTDDGSNEEDRRTNPAMLNKKTGVDYWDAFPLDSSGDVRRWQRDCEIHSQSQSQPHSMQQSHGRRNSRSNGRRGHVRVNSYARSDDYRSSMAAATAIAGMRHGTRSPNTSVSAASKTFEPAPSPMLTVDNTTSSTHNTAQNVWMQASNSSLTSGAEQSMSTVESLQEPWLGPMTQSKTVIGTESVVSNSQNMGLYPGDFQHNLFW